jgi:hypothetical protein
MQFAHVIRIVGVQFVDAGADEVDCCSDASGCPREEVGESTGTQEDEMSLERL